MLKNAQIRAINRMLGFNDESAAVSDGETRLPPPGSSHAAFKILVLDAACRSIISPIFSVQQLRRRGVTLHLLLTAPREPIPDVPAIYFCQPTKENLAIIAQDCAKGLYGRYHLNFVTKLDRTLMEEFAKLVVQSGSLHSIASVHDQYLDYVCLEQNLFSLHKSNSYVTINGSGATEQSIEQTMTEVAYGLFSVVASLGLIPVIRCPRVRPSSRRCCLAFPLSVHVYRHYLFVCCMELDDFSPTGIYYFIFNCYFIGCIQGGAPEMVARKLNRMIAEHPTLLRNKSSITRPLLVILDRNSDLITPVQHNSTYQALIDDLLKHNANRVEFEVVQDETSKRPKKVVKKYDLDPDTDPFYSSQKFQPFPEAIESNGSELQEVTTREQEIRSKAVGAPSPADPLATGANDLATAVDSLPALLDRKKQLEVHTSILQAVMNEVAARDVPQFYELESSLATGHFKNDPDKARRDVLELIGDPAKGNVNDKLRLLIVFALATAAKSSELEEISAALQESVRDAANEDPTVRDKLASGQKALSYLKQLRSMQMIPSATDMLQTSSSQKGTSGAGSESTMLSSLMAKATTQATGLLAKATDKVASMLGKIHKHHATTVVENLCEMKPGSEDETYLYLDPKVKGDVDVLKLRQMTTRAPIREVVAFVIGGGSYGEYQNLQMLKNDRRSISYGSTELLNSDGFLAQLGQLG